MKKLIKSLLYVSAILVMALLCFTACDAEDMVSGFCDHTPDDYVLIESTATCIEGGISVYRCPKCGDRYQIPSEKAEHKTKVIEGFAASCTDDGLSNGQVCEICGEVVEEQKIIYAHHTVEKIAAVEPTCTEGGHTEEEKCSVCGISIKESKPVKALGHDYQITKGYEATCTSDGLSDGVKCTRCSHTESEQEVIPAGHKLITIKGYPSTCKEDGLTNGEKCSACEYVKTEQTVIKAGHKATVLSGYDATCRSNGLSQGSKCSDCKQVLTSQYTIYSNGHNYVNGVCTGCDIEITALNYRQGTPFVGATTGYIVTGVQSGFTGDTIVIPDTYNGSPVVGIDAYAFEGNTSVKTVVIPDTVEYVGANAFNGCSSLEFIELSDFNLVTSDWDADWYGDANVKLTAIFNHGMTPYEVYVEAMNSVGHNYTNYTWSSYSNVYWAAPGQEVPVGYLMMSQSTVQKQVGDNFSYYSCNSDHMSNADDEISEFYYVDGYYYTENSDGWLKISMSKEAFYAAQTISSAQFELTPEHFKDVQFYKDTNGKMYLELAFDSVVFTQMLEEFAGETFPGLISNPVYTYVFAANGDLESYGYTSGLQSIDPNTMEPVDAMRIESRSEFTDINNTVINIPGGAVDSSYTCTNHISVTAPQIDSTCFAEGRTSYTYCARCYQLLEGEMQPIAPAHQYVNGECVKCGTFQDPQTSRNLAYTVNEAATGYVVVGIGACQDTVVRIPSHIYGLAITEVSATAFEGTSVEKVIIGTNEYLISEFTGWRAQ